MAAAAGLGAGGGGRAGRAEQDRIKRTLNTKALVDGTGDAAIDGAVAGPAEMQRLRRLFPGISQSTINQLAVLDEVRVWWGGYGGNRGEMGNKGGST